jgi:2'-5' RNA ligase
MRTIRAFVAIELNEAIKAALGATQGQLKRSPASHIAKWVKPQSIHLTLKFLGDIADNRVEPIGEALQRACAQVQPFTLSLSETGCFPNTKRPRVIWIGVGGELEPLMQLQRAVEAEINPLGFEAERRGFTPHLTLARIRNKARPSERQELGQRLGTVEVDPSVAMTVQELSLMRSELRPRGAVYTRLLAVPLLDREPAA